MVVLKTPQQSLKSTSLAFLLLLFFHGVIYYEQLFSSHQGDYSKVRHQPPKKHWTKLHLTFLYTHYINQYTAKDTVGKEYGDLAANIGPTSEKPFTNTFSNQSFNYSKESVFRQFRTSPASHSWEALNNHMWPEKPIQAGQRISKGVCRLKHCHTQELLTGAVS